MMKFIELGGQRFDLVGADARVVLFFIRAESFFVAVFSTVITVSIEVATVSFDVVIVFVAPGVVLIWTSSSSSSTTTTTATTTSSESSSSWWATASLIVVCIINNEFVIVELVLFWFSWDPSSFDFGFRIRIRFSVVILDGLENSLVFRRRCLFVFALSFIVDKSFGHID